LNIHYLQNYIIIGLKNNGIDAIYEKQKLDENELEQIVLQIKKKKLMVLMLLYHLKKYYTFFR
jgi:hypothetical protein